MKKSANYGSAHDGGARQQFVPMQTQDKRGRQVNKKIQQRNKEQDSSLNYFEYKL